MCHRNSHINLILFVGFILGYGQLAYSDVSSTYQMLDQKEQIQFSNQYRAHSERQDLELLSRNKSFTYKLQSGLKFRGIQLTENLFLIDDRMANRVVNLGLCLATENILYRISPNTISVALNY